jgi:long-chain acyl-CoA synthetase
MPPHPGTPDLKTDETMDFNLAVMLRESARRVPGKPAVILGETTISYTQLDALSDRVAASLSTAGMAAGDRVGLQLPNIPQFIIAYFGILKAGGVVVPMNVLLKASEIEFQLRDSGARTLITTACPSMRRPRPPKWPA